MKPLKVEMNFFGPYEHGVIDFEKFIASPLFLISGPTGAGKTTIFDAMTFALFGVGSGDRKPEEMRSNFAKAEDQTQVRFWFEHQGRVYLVERTPAQERPKRGGGTTRDNTKSLLVELNPLDLTESLALNINKLKEVNIFIQDLLSLSAEQFRQIILLPQAQFQKFLTASSGDKESILRDLFGTKIYLDFTDRIKAQANELGKKQAVKDQQIDNLFEQINWNDEQIAQLAAARSLDQRQQILATEFDTQMKKLKQLETTLKVTESQISSTNQKLQKAQGLQKDFDRLAMLQTEAEKLALQATEMQLKAQQAKQYLWVAQQASTLDQLLEIREGLPILTAEINKIASAIAEYNTQLTEQAKTSKVLLTRAPAISEAHERISQIKEFWLPILDNLAKFEKDYHSATLNAQMMYDQKAVLEQQKKKLKTQIEGHQQILLNSVNLPQTIADSKELFLLLKQAQIPAIAISVLATKFAEIDRDLAIKQSEANKLQGQVDEQVKIVEQQRDRRQKLMIAQLQNELTDGEACVVCGSTSHPFMKENMHEHVTDRQIRDAIDALEQENKDLVSMNAHLTALNVQIKELQDRKADHQVTLDSSNLELINAHQKMLEFAYQHFNIEGPTEFNIDEWDTIILNLQKKIEAHKQLIEETQQVVNKLEADLPKLEDKIKSLDSRFDSYSGQRKSACDDIANIKQNNPNLQTRDSYQKQLAELNKQITSYDQELAENTKAEQETKIAFASAEAKHKALVDQQAMNETKQNDLTNTLLAAIVEQDGIDNIDNLVTLLEKERRENISQKLGQIVTKYEADVAHNSLDLKEIKALIADQKQPVIKELENEVAQLNVTRETNVTNQTEQYALVKQIETVQTQIEALIKELGTQAVKLAELNQLSATVSGKNDQRLTLERFVLQSFLNEVLQHANQSYFDKLTDNRYQFFVKQDAGSNANQTGLEINIYDNDAGKFRAVDTLSGGETFLASLAIALSLAEVIQNRAGGIQIEALFIDEGFGSLDQATLTKAMDTLNVLQQSGRIIGIISHVESMKHEIQQQLQVIKHGDGQSSLKYQLI